MLTRFRLRFGLLGALRLRGPGTHFRTQFATLGPKGPNDPCSGQKFSTGSPLSALFKWRERKLSTNLFFSNFPGTSGISRQNPGISRQKSLVSLVSRDIPNFSAPAPSRGRPPPHPKISGPKSLGLGSFFLPEDGQFLDRFCASQERQADDRGDSEETKRNTQQWAKVSSVPRKACPVLLAQLFWPPSKNIRKSVVSIKFPPVILGAEMAAPILWAPGIFWFFLLEKPHAHKIPPFRGGGGVLGLFRRGGVEVPILFL